MTLVSASDVTTRMVGRWAPCSEDNWFLEKAIEFAADGNWYALTPQNGTFVRNYGLETSGTFSVRDSASGFLFDADFYWKSPSIPSQKMDVGFEESPTRMFLRGSQYVAIP